MNSKDVNFDDTFITAQGWMVSVLNLKGNELLCFSLIYGFSQDGETEFKGSLKFIRKWLSCSKNTAIKTTDSLHEKGFIIKRQETISGVTFNRYSANLEIIRKLRKSCTGGAKTEPGGVQKLNRGGAKTEPNIYTSNIVSNNSINESDKIDFEVDENLPAEEQLIRKSILKAKAYFVEYESMIEVVKSNGKILPTDDFNLDEEIEKWIRHNSGNLFLLQNPGKFVPKSFIPWVKRFHQFKSSRTKSNQTQNGKTRNNRNLFSEQDARQVFDDLMSDDPRYNGGVES